MQNNNLKPTLKKLELFMFISLIYKIVKNVHMHSKPNKKNNTLFTVFKHLCFSMLSVFLRAMIKTYIPDNSPILHQ